MHSSKHTVALLCLAVVSACQCNKPASAPPECQGVSGVQGDFLSACTGDEVCDLHHACRDVKESAGLKCCLFVDRTCTTEADCCPGQTCPADRKKCFDKAVSCEKDIDCGSVDRFCEAYTDPYGTALRCQLHACGPSGECPWGQACFQGECLMGLPCDGHCEPGKGCVASLERCQDFSNPAGRPEAACPMTCGVGFIAAFANGHNLWDSCNLSQVRCVCAELPGLQSNDLGRHSAIAADPGKAVFVSAYDGQFGDLVVVKYGLDGKRMAVEYVDGVPPGAVKYGPTGPRGGVVDKGPDVGRYTDIAVGDGRVYVSYYDVESGDLKVAVRNREGQWAHHLVDGATADLGLYTSIALDADGFPGVSYFQRAGEEGFDAASCPAPKPTGPGKYITAFKFAHASSATPGGAADWSVKTLACLERPAPVCEGCPGVCADPGTPGCYAAATDCTATCDTNSEACIEVNGKSQCAKKHKIVALADIPLGVGLFSSLIFDKKDALVAYALRRPPATPGASVDSDLYGIRVFADGAPSSPVLLDAEGNTGYFPDIKIDPFSRNIAVSYHDFTSKSLKFFFAPRFQTGVVAEVIDSGADGQGVQSWVGTDSALVFGSSAGQLWAVYQDATKGDLKVARRSPTWQKQRSVVTQGAVGFFADGVFSDGKVYVSHALLKTQLVRGEAALANALLLEKLAEGE